MEFSQVWGTGEKRLGGKERGKQRIIHVCCVWDSVFKKNLSNHLCYFSVKNPDMQDWPGRKPALWKWFRLG